MCSPWSTSTICYYGSVYMDVYIGKMDEQMDGWINKWMNKLIDGQMDYKQVMNYKHIFSGGITVDESHGFY